MKMIFAVLFSVFYFSSSLTFATSNHPIPSKVQDFYKNIINDYNINCVSTQLSDDDVFGPRLYIYFIKKGESIPTSESFINFIDFHLYGEHFKTTYKITKKGDLEMLRVVHYKNACISRYPVGDGCRPIGVYRTIITVVKNSLSGRVSEASSSDDTRRLNIFGNLKKNWDGRGLTDYSCKNGVAKEISK